MKMGLNINDESGWLFENPKDNIVHDIDESEIEQLLQLGEQEDVWTQNVKDEVRYADKHPGDFVADQLRIINTSGTVVRYPFGISTVTFPSRRHLFRGEPQVYKNSLPSLNRKLQGKTDSEKELWKSLANLRICQFYKFIWNINVVPYWQAKLSDINIKALSQHYGFDTHLLDLTNDVKTALFFATCKYIPETDSYRPLTEEDFNEENKKYGVIFHTPDWQMDYFQPEAMLRLASRHGMEFGQPLGLDNGDVDGIAFQIGLQPLMRCHYQSGYILPMKEDAPLQDNWHFEKIRFKQSPELSQRIFEMMDGGKKVFPQEGISEARDILDRMKHNMIFSEHDVEYVYREENIEGTRKQSLEEFKNLLTAFDFDGEKIRIRKEEVEYTMTQDMLDRINGQYDGKDLLEPTGGMFHTTSDERKYREQCCMEIYGKLI